MTEAEAKNKECPTRTYCTNEHGVIQYGESAFYTQATCLGSGCMAWRWCDEYASKPIGSGHTLNEPTGYCGLAGKP